MLSPLSAEPRVLSVVGPVPNPCIPACIALNRASPCLNSSTCLFGVAACGVGQGGNAEVKVAWPAQPAAEDAHSSVLLFCSVASNSGLTTVIIFFPGSVPVLFLG